MISQELSWRMEEITMVCVLSYRELKISQTAFHKGENVHTPK